MQAFPFCFSFKLHTLLGRCILSYICVTLRVLMSIFRISWITDTQWLPPKAGRSKVKWKCTASRKPRGSVSLLHLPYADFQTVMSCFLPEGEQTLHLLLMLWTIFPFGTPLLEACTCLITSHWKDLLELSRILELTSDERACVLMTAIVRKPEYF